jgi:prephenate dehydrogenase
MALRSRSPETHITIWGRNATQLQEIRQRKLADDIHTDAAVAVAESDFVILCTPVEVMGELASVISPHLPVKAVVTDAGSIKVSVTEGLVPVLGRRFVGGHPMAGSERSGIAAARADLFAGAPCILTPIETTDPDAVRQAAAFWTLLGGRITLLSPEEHDRIVARLSHLPHALAFALVNLVAETLPDGAKLLAGGSFRDATRVAASDPALWTGILTGNRTELAAALREMSRLLKSMAVALGEERPDDIFDFLKRAKIYRDSLPLPLPDDPS